MTTTTTTTTTTAEPHDRMTFADKAALANERSIKAGMGPLFSRADIRAFVGNRDEAGNVGLEPGVEVEASPPRGG